MPKRLIIVFISLTFIIYSIVDPKISEAAEECKLSITPSEGITIASSIELSGENITSGSRVVVFFDGDAIDITNPLQIDLPINGFVPTPSFSGYMIPSRYMTTGYHTISLRNRNGRRDWFNPTTSEIDFFDAPVCLINFTVGTVDFPGSVIGGGVKTSSSGNPCDANGIQTAIGCIHTQPVTLTKDLLKFLIAISGGIAFLLMVLGAFGMITSAGNPENLEASKDRFSKAVIGLLTVVFAVLLLKVIGVDILGLGAYLGA